jgi:hypothetical protein
MYRPRHAVPRPDCPANAVGRPKKKRTVVSIFDSYASFAAKRVICKAAEGILYCRNIVSEFLEYTLVGVTAGLILEWVLTVVSGNTLRCLVYRNDGTVVGMVFGIVHRHER